ncbi:hypothetical protein BN1723_009102 [Verticillium longisporum]|uniref:Uncharacterized protein n=1 Tax=Verticillium longisporum TaxID=100787 RepID=A0A0G4KLW5_VERLO|nr:hypothetical protein BN1708_009362 [Verticillium longisporum]CRK09948.1 hypothetical protein BN1723_009102 [Verticillium longisporum]
MSSEKVVKSVEEGSSPSPRMPMALFASTWNFGQSQIFYVDRALKTPELFCAALAGAWVWDDGYVNAFGVITTRSDLSCISGAEAGRTREGEASQALENGALAR